MHLIGSDSPVPTPGRCGAHQTAAPGDAGATRRCVVAWLLGGAPLLARSQAPAGAVHTPDRRWYEAAAAMKRLAQSWGDQAYGAVLVLDDQIVGEGPSRVVKHGDPNAHAEREAIHDAQRRLQRTKLDGSILYSTSRPCAACEAAAAAAGVSRMVFGGSLQDAGVPRSVPRP
jgi:tRNA(adenine34) deaminase